METSSSRVQLFEERYKITDRTIGDGANSLVYLAYDITSGQQVACKVHDLNRYRRSTRQQQRLRQEATLLSFLDHVGPQCRRMGVFNIVLIVQPNILAIRAAFKTDQTM